MSNPHPYGQHQPTGFQPPGASGTPPAPPPPATIQGTSRPSHTSGPAPSRPRRSGVFGPVTAAAAVLALLFSLVAVVLAFRANDRASQALAQPAGQPTAAVLQPPTTDPVPTDTADADPTPTPTATDAVPELNAQTKYAVKYTDQKLRISAGATCSSVSIDLDEPRVGTDDTRKDLTFARPCAPAGARIELGDGAQGSLADAESVQPTECADQIRTSPLAAGSQPIRTGQVFCINTSLDAARSQAITWKMVVLTVTAMAQDGTVTFQVTAWDIPV